MVKSTFEETQEVKRQVQMAKSRDLLADILMKDNTKLPYWDQKQLYYNFCNMVLNENPYISDNDQKVSFGVDYIKDKNVQGNTNVPTGIVTISEPFLHDVLITKKIPLAQALYVLGHERRHVSQVNAQKNQAKYYEVMNDQQKREAEALFLDIGNEQTKESTVPFIMSILSSSMNPEDVKKIKSMTQDQQKELCKTFVFDNYLKYTHEVDARKTGYEFASFMLEAFTNDPRLEKFARKELESQKQFIEREQQKNEQIMKYSDQYRAMVNTAIENSEYDDILESAKKIEDQISSMFTTEEVEEKYGSNASNVLSNFKSNARMSINEAIEYISYQKAKQQTSEEIIQNIYMSPLSGYTNAIDHLLKILNTKSDYTKEHEKVLKATIVDMLEYGDLPVESYSYDYTKLLSKKETMNLADRLMDTGKVSLAGSIIGTMRPDVVLDPYTDKEQKALNNAKIKLLAAMTKELDTIESQGKLSFLELQHLYLSTPLPEHYGHESMFDPLRKRIDSLIVDTQMQGEEEILYLESKYGKRLSRSLIDNDKNSDLRLWLEYLDEKKKEKDEKEKNKRINEGRLIESGERES